MPISEIAKDPRHPIRLLNKSTHTMYPVSGPPVARRAQRRRSGAATVGAGGPCEAAHVPTRARDLPARLWHEVEGADVVMHAGDWMAESLFEELEERSTRLVACWGNNDGPELRSRIPEVARVTLDGVRFAVVHETGPAKGRERRMSAVHPGIDVLVFGRSHIPWDTVTESGLRLLNPGSPTDRRRQPYCTYMTATVSGGELTDVELQRL